MLPFIIGGIALAATGYGIKKYFEDEDNYEKIDEYEEETKNHTSRVDLSEVLFSSQNIEPTDIVKKPKTKFFKITLHDLQTALSEIKNLNGAIYITPPEQIDENRDFSVLSDEIKVKLDSFVAILSNTQSYIDANLDKLDAIIISLDDYTAYSDEDKRFVQNLLELHNTIEKVTNSALTHDGETISREMQRAFGKIQNMVS